MEMQLLSSTFHTKNSWKRWNSSDQKCTTATGFRPNINCTFNGPRRKVSANKKYLSTSSTKQTTELSSSDDSGHVVKKGTIAGAIALITGTSIGSGILAIPQKTSPAGFIPSASGIIVCWLFLLVEALLLAEINVFLLRDKETRNTTKEEKLEIISITTMAQETLGEWGGAITTLNYVFLGYTTLVAYTSKSGQIINHLTNVPSNICGCLFALLFSFLISVGSTRTTDQVNQWLTTIMIVLLVAIEALAVSSGEWSWFEADGGNWGKVPATIPVIIFTLVYHDLAPVICAYLGGDLARIRVSITLGSLVPLVVLLLWDAVALGLSVHADQVADPVEMLMGLRGGGISAMVEAFSLLAVGTSLIGTILGFSQFFMEQLSLLSEPSQFSPSSTIQMLEGKGETSTSKNVRRSLGLRVWWSSNKLSIAATTLAVVPPLLISTNVPDVFSAATDIAGGYCMTILYGVLPPAMAWAIQKRSSDDAPCSKDDKEGDRDEKGKKMFKVKSLLILMGLIACALVLEQILKDFSVLNM